jgi:tetratricopeptide (TPR) repeat protein
MKTILLATILAIPVYGQVCVDKVKVTDPPLSDAAREGHTKNLEIARANYAAKPDADNLIWLARRHAYLGDYKEAVKLLTNGIEQYPRDARFLRHRGHRYITLRCFNDAIRDLQKAEVMVPYSKDEVEPDGIPNERNVPTSTLRTNIFYHLGLAHYLVGDFGRAAGAFMNAYNAATNPDMKVAAAHWVYMSARRFGDEAGPTGLLKREIKDDLDIIENHDYYTLIKLYKGRITSNDLEKGIGEKAETLSNASLGYGLGNWYFYNGDKTKAVEIFRKIVAGNQWASFGYIAAESDLARLK